MSFIHGFTKVAKTDDKPGGEHAALAKRVSALPSPDKKPGAKDLKEGSKVCYTSGTGWKEGPRGSHSKRCNVDDERKPLRDKYQNELKTHGLDGPEVHEIVNKKYPDHHSGEWKDEAVHIGDEGTVVEVKSSKTQPNKYAVTWDKHPDCHWKYYSHNDLKLIPKKTKT